MTDELLNKKMTQVLDAHGLPNIRAAERRVEEMKATNGDPKELAALELLLAAYALDARE